MIDIALVGTSGMLPLPHRHLASALIRYQGRMVLIDCGEGTQVSLQQLGWGIKNIDVICLTHFHADHIMGITGLLLSIGNADRTKPLTIMGPKHLKQVMAGLLQVSGGLPYALELVELPHKDTARYDFGDFVIKAQRVKHWVECFAYVIETKRQPKFDYKKAMDLNIPRRLWSQLQQGKTVRYGVTKFRPSQVLGPDRTGFKIAYCTDSRPTPNLPNFVERADLFICEAMYFDEEKADKALEGHHMMANEAIEMAIQGRVKALWLTHFSPSVSDPLSYQSQVSGLGISITIGTDRMTTTLTYESKND